MRFLLFLCLIVVIRSAPQPQRSASFARQLPVGFRPAKQVSPNEDGAAVKVQPESTSLHRQQLQHEQEQEIKTTPAAAAAAAPTTSVPLPPVDKTVDLDGDGALSLAEVQYAAFVHHALSSPVVEEMFREVDKNKDGYLTSLEFNDIRPLVLAKAESAALRFLQTVDTDRNGLLSLSEAQAYILTEYGIGNKDVERTWRLVLPNGNDEMDAVMFSKLRRRIRGMSIRLARQLMKAADKNENGHIDVKEAQQVAFEQEGLGAAEVHDMIIAVDDNNDGELNAPEFADFEKLLRAKGVDVARRALKVVDKDGSGYLTMDEAKRIAFDHYGFDEKTLTPFFGQADENEDGQLDAVEFAGFRSVIRSKAIKNAIIAMQDMDTDGDNLISGVEAVNVVRKQDDMDAKEIYNLFNLADQDKSGKLDKVELSDFLRLVRLNAIKFATDHFREFDVNKDKIVTVDELESSIEHKYNVDPKITRQFFEKVDVDNSGDLSPGEIVDFRHEIRRYVAERGSQQELARLKQDEVKKTIRNEPARVNPEPANPDSKVDVEKNVDQSPNADDDELQKQEEIARRRQMMLQRSEKRERIDKEGNDDRHKDDDSNDETVDTAELPNTVAKDVKDVESLQNPEVNAESEQAQPERTSENSETEKEDRRDQQEEAKEVPEDSKAESTSEKVKDNEDDDEFKVPKGNTQ
uniref:Calmodulin n=1 Tax=Syphacia muris TaxID=451379 RepID=A0A0N5ASJ6_9BILA